MRIVDLRMLFTVDLQAERDKVRASSDGIVDLPVMIGVHQWGKLMISPDLTVKTDDPDVWRAVIENGVMIGVIYPNEPDDQPWNSTIPPEWEGLPGTEGLEMRDGD